MYIGEILMYLTWPLLIAISYFAVRWMLRRFEINLQKEESKKKE